jgi:hypothetical protein
MAAWRLAGRIGRPRAEGRRPWRSSKEGDDSAYRSKGAAAPNVGGRMRRQRSSEKGAIIGDPKGVKLTGMGWGWRRPMEVQRAIVSRGTNLSEPTAVACHDYNARPTPKPTLRSSPRLHVTETRGNIQQREKTRFAEHHHPFTSVGPTKGTCKATREAPNPRCLVLFRDCHPTHVYLFVSRHCLMKQPQPTLRLHLSETGSVLDIWLVPYKRLVGCPLSLTLVIRH